MNKKQTIEAIVALLSTPELKVSVSGAGIPEEQYLAHPDLVLISRYELTEVLKLLKRQK